MPALIVAQLTAYGLFLGGALASFACVVSERVPAGLPITGRSVCACGRKLHVWENVPALGWLSCRGVTRCCKSKLPARYVVSELALSASVGLLAFGAAYRMVHGGDVLGPTVAAVFVAVVGLIMVAGATWQCPTCPQEH